MGTTVNCSYTDSYCTAVIIRFNTYKKNQFAFGPNPRPDPTRPDPAFLWTRPETRPVDFSQTRTSLIYVHTKEAFKLTYNRALSRHFFPYQMTFFIHL